jgi:sortase (surface protein transpeptidase)
MEDCHVMPWKNAVGALVVMGAVLGSAGCAEQRPVRVVGDVMAMAKGLEVAAPSVDTGAEAPAEAAPTAAVAAPDTAPVAEQPVAAAPAPLVEPAAEPVVPPVGLDPSAGAAPAYPYPWQPQPAPTEPVQAPIVYPTPTPFPTVTPPPTATPDFLAQAGPPVQVEIPAIGVTALIEQVGLTADGAMATPKGWMNVAWFSRGTRPGEPGNSVMAGHLDSRSGGPAVFWSLNQLQPGDEVIVSYQNGDRYTFAVEYLEIVPYDISGPAVTAIFGASQTADLNLITCNGDWDRGKATYTERLVVYTTLVPEKSVHGGFQGSYD